MSDKYYVHTIDTFTNQNVVVEVTKEVYEIMTKSNRKERYFSKELKQEIIQVDQENKSVKIKKSREDSFERLTQELSKDFPDNFSLESDCEKRLFVFESLSKLNMEEFELIYSLYYHDMTERCYAQKHHISQSTINHRKNKILKKLKKHIESQ